ncbi:glycosyl transferase family 2 [Hydrogenispora ethanolica]|uniref:Glycosyl transferase family 2 n=1 Tax=Hydrogenispora ethanolica TaxID=1082276 RepID=A0A4R1RSG2_HYDET|nr:glycosyltransferase family 2 protein [Hydrogenispora ethanolica]TCL69425.1 glycosyl transferase family 2 [Hydrogenispora ethanolica]
MPQGDQPLLHQRGISLFFPAYNEEANVAVTIDKSLAVVEPLGCEYEIIVVDDGSKDRTSEVVSSYVRRNQHVVLQKHLKNQGYGGALQTGFLSCRYGLIFFSDCDLQFNLSELIGFIDVMEKDPTLDAVIGYRIRRVDSVIRKINAWGWNLWARLLFDLKFKDIDCAFKLLKKEVLEQIAIESTGALVSLELLAKIRNGGYRILEIGVHHYPRKEGRPTGAKLSVIFRAFYESFKLYGKIKSSKPKTT